MGKKPAETNIQEISFISRAKEEKGCTIIVIDPSADSQTADKADMLFRPRPGTDGALALALARYY